MRKVVEEPVRIGREGKIFGNAGAAKGMPLLSIADYRMRWGFRRGIRICFVQGRLRWL